MSRKAYIRRLEEEQQKALADTSEQITIWEKFQTDYINLQKKIKSLPEHISHEYMVPFGPLAMMPGKLIHTNEILVLLGDNWFAEMSAVQACQVIDRRLKEVCNTINKFKEQKKLLETRAHFTQHEFYTQDEVEITEDYDSDTERRWRDKHRENLKKSKAKELGGCTSAGDALRTLDLLENEEVRDSGMSRLPEDDSQATDFQNAQKGRQAVWEIDNKDRKTVHWEDEEIIGPKIFMANESDYEELSPLDSDDSRELPSVISFEHTHAFEHQESDKTSADIIESPRDIYERFMKPKSILKQNSDSSSQQKVIKEIKCEEHNMPSHSKANVGDNDLNIPVAVHNHVIEKVCMDESRLIDNVLPEQTKQPAKISKFKALRQKQGS